MTVGIRDLTLVHTQNQEQTKSLDTDKVQKSYKYDFLKPAYPDLKWAPLEKVEVKDAALRVQSGSYEHLFGAASAVQNLTPKIGTEIVGVKLEELTDVQKDELALLIAYRGVVVFRDQPGFDIDSQLALGRYWGPLHKHATTSVPRAWKERELEEVHVVWADSRSAPTNPFPQTYLWHSDVTYEVQPPSYTSLKLLSGPEAGGDTAWTLGYAIYDALSPPMREYLSKLTALHSAEEQAQDSLVAGHPVRRAPVTTEHPLIRTHPVTGYNSVFVNPGFTRSIVGVPRAESEAILSYLNTLVATQIEASVRVKWRPEDVVFWDNRICNHTPSYGFYPHQRHAVRVAVTGEVPELKPDGLSQQQVIDEASGITTRSLDGSRRGNYND